MPPLTIPSEYRPALITLQNLSTDAIDELIGALRKAPVKFYREQLVEALKDVVKLTSPSDLADIVDMLASLEFVRESAEVDLDQFIADLEEAFKRDKLPAQNVDGTSTMARIRQLLEIPSLVVPAKARTLLLEGKTLCRARVVTDMRPVFDASDPPQRPEGAVIVHHLRLSYHEAGTRLVREFTVSLDADDLDALIDVLGRAKTKERILEGTLKKANVPYLKIE